MLIFDRIRNIHDDIVFRYMPDFREWAPLALSGAFLLALTSILTTTLIGGSANESDWRHRTPAVSTTLGAKLRLSHPSGAALLHQEIAHAPSPVADIDDPDSPMLVDIDPENVTIHASAGTIDVRGTPINIGNWTLD